MIYNGFYSDCLNFIRTLWNRPCSQPFCEWLIYSWCLDGSGNETQYSRWHWWFHAVSVHVHTEPLDSTFPRLHNNHKQTVKPPQANAVQQRHNCFHNSIIDNTITRRLLKVYYEIELNRWLLFDSLSDDHRQNLMGNGQIWWETANLMGHGKIWWEIAKSDRNLMGNGQIWWETAKSDGKWPNLMGNGKIWWKIAGLLSHTLNWDRAGQTQTGIVRAGARTGLAVRWGKFVVLSEVFPNLLVGGSIASLLGGTSPRPCRDFNVLSPSHMFDWSTLHRPFQSVQRHPAKCS